MGLGKSVPGSFDRIAGKLNPAFDFADAGHVLVQLPLIGLGDAIVNAFGIVEHVVEHAPAVKVAIGDRCLRQAVAPLGEETIKNHLGIHFVGGGRGRCLPGDVRLVCPAVTKCVAGTWRLAAKLKTGKAGRVANVPSIELVDGGPDTNSILCFQGLGTGQKARRTLPVPATFAIAIGERRIVRQTVERVEVLAREGKRP